MQMFSKANRTPYHPNRFDAVPVVPVEKGGFDSYPEKMESIKARIHGPKFEVGSSSYGFLFRVAYKQEYLDQATLFYNSMSEPEREHMIAAAQFELSKCYEHVVQQKAIERFNEIDHDFAVAVAEVFPAVKVPAAIKPNHGKKSEFLSQVNGKSQGECLII